MNRVRETKSLLCYLGAKEKQRQVKYASTLDTYSETKKGDKEKEDDDPKSIREDAKYENSENDITEIKSSVDGPLIIKVADIKVNVNIAATKRVPAQAKKGEGDHESKGAIVVSLDISEAIFSSGQNPTKIAISHT